LYRTLTRNVKVTRRVIEERIETGARLVSVIDRAVGYVIVYLTRKICEGKPTCEKSRLSGCDVPINNIMSSVCSRERIRRSGPRESLPLMAGAANHDGKPYLWAAVSCCGFLTNSRSCCRFQSGGCGRVASAYRYAMASIDVAPRSKTGCARGIDVNSIC
jgi:hypothetical protein